jgi:hypothetical protein
MGSDCIPDIVSETYNLWLLVGQRIDLGGLLKDSKIELNPNKTIKADPITFQTGELDVFAGGAIVLPFFILLKRGEVICMRLEF